MTIKKNNENRDEQDMARLYFLLQYHYQPPEQLKKINSNVYYVKFPSNLPVVMKAFTSYQKLQRQQILTDYLVSLGFPTYTFLKDYGVIFEQSRYFTMISYLEVGKPIFSFRNLEDCTSGLLLLKHYHDLTESFPQKQIFPVFNQYKKWETRLKEFQGNLSFLNGLAKEQHVKNLIGIAQWSLEKMGKYQDEVHQEKLVITHGDVAHHNFLRTKNNHLYLIDFDLAAVAPRVIDYLQYAQRLLSFNKVEIQALLKMPVIQSYSSNNWFLAALAYPSEIFRETNRIIRNRTDDNYSSSLHRLEKMWQQYKIRQEIFLSIRDIVK